MSTLVTFPALPLRAALEGLLRGIGRLDCETLRHEYGPSVDTITPLVEAVAAAEEERAELVLALDYIVGWNTAGWSAETARDMAWAALAKARGEAAEVPS